MTAVSALGAAATLVASAFALCTGERWLRRRRPHEAAWTQSLIMFALGSLAYWWAGAVGWNSANFRAFYLFGAILNVPYLAVGTVFLLGGSVIGRRVGSGCICWQRSAPGRCSRRRPLARSPPPACPKAVKCSAWGPG